MKNPLIQRVYNQINGDSLGLSQTLKDKINAKLSEYDARDKGITKAQYREIYAQTIEEIGCGDYGADWDVFEYDWQYIRTGDDSVYDDY